MRLIIGIAAPLGGTSLTSGSVHYPYAYDLDYIRVYQLNEDCGTEEIYYCYPEPPVEDGYTVQKSITFGCTSGEADFSNIQTSLYANNFILIDENTTLGGGTSTIYLDVKDWCNP